MIYPGIRSEVGSTIRTALDRIASVASFEAQLSAIFAGGAKGAWYERSNLSSLYQEPSGVTPVSAAGQIVGRGLSRDQGVKRGPELVVNGGFDSDTAWTKGVGWSISGGMARINGSNTGSSLLTATDPLVGLVVGATYEAQYDYVSTSGRLRFNPVVGSAGALVASGSSGRYRSFFVASGDPTSLAIQAPDANTVATVDLVSVMLVPGNHQIQATAGLKPLYQTGPKRLVFDGVDDVLTTTFPAALGSNCTVIRAIPGTGVVITASQTIGTSFADSVSASVLMIVDRPLTATETNAAIGYGNQQALL